MHREDNSKYLLYIEPKANEKLTNPIDDELTQLMEMALSKAKIGGARYSNLDDLGDGHDIIWRETTQRVPSFMEGAGFMGMHTTECGEWSDNHDYLLENGMITNSLATFYLRWYRNSIPESEIKKLEQLKKYYK